MAQCNFPECTRRAIGGFEHHELGTAPDRTPIINRTETVVWCAKHEYALQKYEEFRFEVDFQTKVEIQV